MIKSVYVFPSENVSVCIYCVLVYCVKIVMSVYADVLNVWSSIRMWITWGLCGDGCVSGMGSWMHYSVNMECYMDRVQYVKCS